MDHSFLHSKKLLLVDDEPELLKMGTAILADEGFQHIITAANMEEGIAAVQSEKPDLAILDVMLPDGDGLSLMEKIRAWTDIPVIFLTARDEGSDKLARAGAAAGEADCGGARRNNENGKSAAERVPDHPGIFKDIL